MPLLGVALVAATVASGIFYGLLLPKLRGGANASAGSTLVVARHGLDRGAVLKAEDLRVVPDEARKTRAGAIAGVEQAVGRTLLEPVDAGQPILERALAGRGIAGGASAAIPAGYRAVTIHPADSSGVVSMMRSGSRVDVQVLSARAGEGISLHRMLENVEVLHVYGGNPDAQARPVVTLLVSPREADRLTLADAAMRVRLVLRNPADKAVEGPRALSPAALVSDGSR